MKPTKHGNRWQITYRCPGCPHLINESFETEKEANLRIAEIEIQRARKTLFPPPEYVDASSSPEVYRQVVTVKCLMDDYIGMYGINKWSPSTMARTSGTINNYILPYIGEFRLKDLSPRKLELFYQDLMTKPPKLQKGISTEGKTVSPAVIAKVHQIMKSALNQAIRWSYLEGNNPALTAEVPNYRRKKREAWSDSEALYALSLCDNNPLRICMLLAIGCSMRVGEICGLTWDNIHIENESDPYLDVIQELARCEKSAVEKLNKNKRCDIYRVFPSLLKSKSDNATTFLCLKAPKTESSIRKIFIPETVVEELKKVRSEQEQEKNYFSDEYRDYNLVIARPDGLPYDRSYISSLFDTFIEEHKLRRVVFHSLRHTSTSLKLRLSGGDIKAVQGDTGHAQSDMVTDVYSHMQDQDRRDLARKVDSEFFRTSDEPKDEQQSLDPTAQAVIKRMQESPEISAMILKMMAFFTV